MKRILIFIIAISFAFSLAACRHTELNYEITTSVPKKTEAAKIPTSAPGSTVEAPKENVKTLVVYFSRTGEQYGVGNIDEGNTAIVAKLIVEELGADIFEILPETDYYPYTYNELTDVAKREQSESARPSIKGELPELSGYDTVFIGAPVWWGDWPMIMYTFFESAELSGKKLVPFSTHEGSGLSGFDQKLASAVSGSEVLEGLAVRGADCQNDFDSVKNKVTEWLNGLGY